VTEDLFIPLRTTIYPPKDWHCPMRILIPYTNEELAVAILELVKERVAVVGPLPRYLLDNILYDARKAMVSDAVDTFLANSKLLKCLLVSDE
jgi:hypothetical protein